MNPIAPLVDYLSQFLALSDAEIEALDARCTLRRLKRRQFLLSEGSVCLHYSFVVAGCFKMYKVDEAGKQHNIHFAVENEWIADIGSFHSQKPSQLYIEAMEAAEVIQLSRPDLIYFFEDNSKFNRIFRVQVEHDYIRLQRRLLQTISTSAEERYQAFMADYPHLANRLPSTQIASYLGITPEFLSRIRNKMTGKA